MRFRLFAARDKPRLDRHDRLPPVIHSHQSQRTPLPTATFSFYLLFARRHGGRGRQTPAKDGLASKPSPVSNRQAVQRPSGASAKMSAPHLAQTKVGVAIPRALLGHDFFRRERGDDFFEARVAAKRSPNWDRDEYRRRYTGRDFRESLQLLNRQVAFAGPCTHHGIKIEHVRAIEGILRNRRELECPAAFLQRLFFSPKCGIDQTQDAESWAGIRL